MKSICLLLFQVSSIRLTPTTRLLPATRDLKASPIRPNPTTRLLRASTIKTMKGDGERSLEQQDSERACFYGAFGTTPRT
uniref:Predicted protein n=1 Tax=Hordeum vulgare subsp. vulgare TaxID=112509 RepID=F2EAH0_HORVV|nr:predicted protein [Hordeum vulgare subsp. vulgare]